MSLPTEPWIEDLLASVRVRPLRIRRHAALALSFWTERAYLYDALDPPYVQCGTLLAEDRLGTPWTGNVFASSPAGFERAAARAEMTLSYKAAHPWMSGSEPFWRIRSALGKEDGDALVPHEARFVRRIRAQIAEALPDAGFSPIFSEALAAMVPGAALKPPEAWHYEAFSGTEAGARVRRFVAANPVLAFLLDEEVKGAAEAVAEPGPATVLPDWPEARRAWFDRPFWTDANVPRAERCLFPVHSRRDKETVLALARAVPLEWLPDGNPEGAAFVRIALAMQGMPESETGAGARRLVRPGRGRWRALEARCSDAMGQSFDRLAALYLRDAAADLSRRLVTPACAHLGHPLATLRPREDTLARALLYRDKALPGMLETARWWHTHLPAILAGVPAEADATGQSWPALFPETRIGGIVLRPLSTARELRDEGASGPDGSGAEGLDHCVASYRPCAHLGKTHVVSLRRDLPGGGYERLATVEIHQEEDGRLVVVQARGRGNGLPPPDAAAALAAFLKANQTLPFMPPREPPPGEVVRRDCGYDWAKRPLLERALAAYAPLLPRDLRTLDAFLAHLPAAGEGLHLTS